MNLEELQKDLKKSYKPTLESSEKRIEHIVKHLNDTFNMPIKRLNLAEMQVLSSTILEKETKVLHDEVEALLIQKEQIQRKIDKKSHDLQESKYNIFNAIELQLNANDDEALSKLHQVKLQTIDLYDLLGEIVESAIISSLEKDIEINETIEEFIKDITYEAIKEGSLSIIRIRKILSTILYSSIEIAEASPVKAEDILTPTLKGMRSGLIHAIARFKQRIAFIPVEAKHILIEDYDTIIEDLNQTDALFTQVVNTQGSNSSQAIQNTLEKISKDMRYDLDELLHISKETAGVMKKRFSSFAVGAVKKADKALQSPKAIEAKRMGKQALGIAKTAIDTAIKSAKEAIEKK